MVVVRLIGESMWMESFVPCRPDRIRKAKYRSWTSQSISWRGVSLKEVRLGTWMPPGKGCRVMVAV